MTHPVSHCVWLVYIALDFSEVLAALGEVLYRKYFK